MASGVASLAAVERHLAGPIGEARNEGRLRGISREIPGMRGQSVRVLH